MEFSVLGKTGLKVSKVGFGGIPLQKVNVEDVQVVLERAEQLGINFIDTARAYTVSEEYIGKALFGRRDKWIIASKTMAYDSDAMLRDVEISLKNLKTDCIDLYQIHNLRTEEQYNKVMAEDGALNALKSLKKQGIIKHIGVTSHSLDMIKILIEEGNFETIMYPYNIIEDQAEDVFKRANELNVGVIAMKPFAGGNIENGEKAIKYILSNDCIDIAIPGMASIKEVEENATIASKFKKLTTEELSEIKQEYNYLGNEFCRRCGYCAPCPKGIDIPSSFLFMGYKKRYNLAKWGEDRYFSMKSTAKDCVECGVCETRCPYNLPIRKMLKEVKTTFNE